MFSIFKKRPIHKTRLIKLKAPGSILPQYSIQEYHRVSGWTNADVVFYAAGDDLALEVYNEWKKKDEVTTIRED